MFRLFFLFTCTVLLLPLIFIFFFFNDTATTEIYTLSLHDALPISARRGDVGRGDRYAHRKAGLATCRRANVWRWRELGRIRRRRRRCVPRSFAARLARRLGDLHCYAAFAGPDTEFQFFSAAHHGQPARRADSLGSEQP